MIKSTKIFKLLVFLLNLLALSPLVISPSVFFPYITGKVIFIRLIITVVSICFSTYFLLDHSFRNEVIGKLRFLYKNPIFLSVSAYFSLFLLSAIFAVDKFSSIFGTPERGEGLVGMLFFFMFFLFVIVLFEKKYWLLFFKTSLFSSLALFLYQCIQIIQNHSSINIVTPGSFMGNQAYLATYFLFGILSSVVVYLCNEHKNKFWYIVSLVTISTSIIGIILTNVRGVTLGIVVGIIVTLLYIAIVSNTWRKVSVAIIVTLVFFTGLFLMTKSSSFWQGIPLFNRLAMISLADESTSTRVYLTKMSIDSINPVQNGIEKFLIGWGGENYFVASNVHYDPDAYAFYEGSAYDRAHNQILDVFVTNGLLGLMAYLAIWFFVLKFVLFGSVDSFIESSKNKLVLRSFLLFFTVAYFVQNLFSFDGVGTYISLFAFFGFMIFLSIKSNDQESSNINQNLNNKKGVFLTCLFSVISVFLLYFLVISTIVPYFQMKIYIKNMSQGDFDKTLKSSFTFSPYTYVQPFIRKDLLTQVIGSSLVPVDKELFDEAILKMEESLKHKDSNPYDYIALALSCVKKAQISGDQSYFKKAEEYYKKAIEKSPKQQKLLLAYGAFLFDHNRKDEAIRILKQIFDLNKNAPFPNFYLGVAEMSLGADYYVEVLDHMETFFQSDFQRNVVNNFLNPDPGWIKTEEVYKNLLAYFYKEKDIDHVYTVTKRLSILYGNKDNVFGQIAKYISETGKLPVINFKK